MRNLSKKIASVYMMQKQAGSGSLLAFPSVMFNLKELSNQAKDQVSDAIVDGLANIFHGIIQASGGEYEVKVLKQETLEGDIPMRNQGKYYSDTGFEAHEIYGANGKKLSLSIQVELEFVAEELAKHLNSEVHQFFAHKILTKEVLKDLKAGSYLNAVAMFVKQGIKSSNIHYDEKVVEEFLMKDAGISLDFLVGIDTDDVDVHQYLDSYSIAVKDVSWSLNTMDFLVNMEVIYVIDPDPNDY
jgi:hypothetical protein